MAISKVSKRRADACYRSSSPSLSSTYHLSLSLLFRNLQLFDIESTANDDSCLYRGSYTGEQSAVGGRRGGEDQTMIAGNCFSAVAYLSRFGQRPQRYAARRLYLLLKRIPYKTQAKSNFFHGPEYIQFVFPPSLFVSLSAFFILSRSLRPALLFSLLRSCVRRD